MAAQAKSIREVRKDDLEQAIEEATEAMAKATDRTLRTNVLRTLESRRTSLIRSGTELVLTTHVKLHLLLHQSRRKKM